MGRGNYQVIQTNMVKKGQISNEVEALEASDVENIR